MITWEFLCQRLGLHLRQLEFALAHPERMLRLRGDTDPALVALFDLPLKLTDCRSELSGSGRTGLLAVPSVIVY